MKTDHNPYESNLFRHWQVKTESLVKILSVKIQSADYVPRRSEPLFIKLAAELCDGDSTFKRVFFLRGSTVAILVILVCEGVEYAVLVEQDHPAVGETFASLPAGMIEGEAVHSAGLRELEEETGVVVIQEELVDLSRLFYGGRWGGIYPSPGACDEIVHIFFCKKEVEKEMIKSINGRITGLEEENERIVVRVVKLNDLCVSTPDPKAHSAFVMYRVLKQKGIVP